MKTLPPQEEGVIAVTYKGGLIPPSLTGGVGARKIKRQGAAVCVCSWPVVLRVLRRGCSAFSCHANTKPRVAVACWTGVGRLANLEAGLRELRAVRLKLVLFAFRDPRGEKPARKLPSCLATATVIVRSGPRCRSTALQLQLTAAGRWAAARARN